MPNPVTQSIVKNIQDAQMLRFVNLWDQLEEIVIRVFRSKTCADQDAELYQQVRGELLELYPQWQPALAPFWQESRVKGQQGLEDPYQVLLAHASAAEFIGDWPALKHLPPAREALNNYLMTFVEEGGES